MDKKTIKILLAEDDAITVMSIAEFFSLRGFNPPKSVSTGLDAVSTVRETQPDILFIDIRLSGEMNGIEASEKIREFSEIPIVFMSGYISEDARERADRLNPAAYLDKPVLLRDLLNVVNRLIGG